MRKISFKPGTMLNPVPAVMVSCGNGDEKNIVTIAWTGIINSEPPMTYVSIRKSRHSNGLIERNKEFVINLTSEKVLAACDICGVKSGRDVDKWDLTKLTPITATKVSCPMIKEAPVNLECKVVDIVNLPSHDMFMAEIVAVHADEEIINEKGKICLEDAALIAYCHGHYFGLKRRPLGRFGFSAMKPKTAKKKAAERRQKSRMKRK